MRLKARAGNANRLHRLVLMSTLREFELFTRPTGYEDEPSTNLWDSIVGRIKHGPHRNVTSPLTRIELFDALLYEVQCVASPAECESRNILE